MAVPSDSLSFKCPFSWCIFKATSMPSVLSHLRLVHANDPNFSVSCGIEGCCKTSNIFLALYQHIYKKHKDAGVIRTRKDAAYIDDCPSNDHHDFVNNFTDLESTVTEGNFKL